MGCPCLWGSFVMIGRVMALDHLNDQPPPPHVLQRSWKGVYWFHLVLPSVRPSVRPSVDRIVSAPYIQQYLSDPFHMCTSYQANWEGVSRVKSASKFKNCNFWYILQICNFDCLFLLGIQYGSIVCIIMRRWGYTQNAGVQVVLVRNWDNIEQCISSTFCCLFYLELCMHN